MIPVLQSDPSSLRSRLIPWRLRIREPSHRNFVLRVCHEYYPPPTFLFFYFSFFLLFLQAHSVPLLLRTMFTPKKNRNIRKKVNIDDGDEAPAQDSGNNTPVPDNGNNIQRTLSTADAIHNLTFTLCFYSNANPLQFFLLYRYR